MQAGSPDRVGRRLAAILAADVAGYSRLMEVDEAGTACLLREYRAAAGPLIAEHEGRIVKTTGDGMLLEFPSVVGAVQCAIALQKLMAERNTGVPSERRLDWRIGVHLGDILIEGDDIIGDGVNLAARLEGIAEPGGICISEDAFRQVRGKIETEFVDGGEQALKNISRPVRVYRAQPAFAPVSSALAAAALPLPDKPSIAVLPFQNLSGDPEQEYFVDGMVEEIITALSRIRWLFVIARNSTFTYKGRAVDVKQVGRELGVRYVLEGSVRKAGGRVRVTAQLIEAETGAHLWADRFDGSLEDVFELQDRVAASVAGVIEPKLHLAEIEHAVQKPTEKLSAYDLYLRALAQSRLLTPDGNRQAADLLQRALAIDPSYAPAAAAMGRYRLGQRVQGLAPISDQEVMEAVGLARHAIETAKDDAYTLSSAAFTLASFAGEHIAAARAIDRALVVNPNCAEAWTAKGWVACYQSDASQAIDAFEHAMRLSPLDPRGFHIAAGCALAHMIAGQYEQAVEWADRSLSERSRYGPPLRTKIVACVQLGRLAEAKALLARMLELQPGLTIAAFGASMTKNFPPQVFDLYIDGLRKAGLPEQ